MIIGEKKSGLHKIGLKFSRGKIFSLVKNSVTFPRIFFPDKVYENLETVRSYSDKRGIEISKNLLFLLISARFIVFRYLNLLFMKQQLPFYKYLKF